MGLKTFTINLTEFSGEISNRFDVNFIDFNKVEKQSTYSFRDFFDIQKFEKKDRLSLLDSLEDDFYYAEIGNSTKQGDVIPEKLNLDDRNEFVADYFKKIDKGDVQKAEIGNILLAKVRPNLKKYILIDEEKEKYFYTTAFINLKPKKLGKLLYYLLRTIFYNDLMAISRQGKGYPTLKEEDLFTLRFDKKTIDKLEKKETQIVSQIEPIEKNIKKLKSQIKEPQEIINKVFAREFGFDLEKFEKLKKINHYYLDLFSFGNNIDIRQSVKFHRDAGYFVNQELKKVTNKKVKNFISEQIVLGKSVSPKDYDENGDYYYVSMANIKNWKFENEDSKLVSVEYSSKNKNKTVAKNDILIARSGEGTIGKVALIDDEDLQGIFADFTMRIRLENYNQLFAYYYFRSEYFQYLVEVNKKGLGNNTNIFPSQIQEFPMIDISLKEQQKIVDEIKTELDNQEEYKKKIANERNKIDEIIEKAIK